MSDTTTSTATRLINRLGRKPFAAAGGTALWGAIDDLRRRHDDQGRRLDRLAARTRKSHRQIAGSTLALKELELRATTADDEIRALRRAVDELSRRLARIEQTPRPRVVPGQPPRPNPDALERREAALAGPVSALSDALGYGDER